MLKWLFKMLDPDPPPPLLDPTTYSVLETARRVSEVSWSAMSVEYQGVIDAQGLIDTVWLDFVSTHDELSLGEPIHVINPFTGQPKTVPAAKCALVTVAERRIGALTWGDFEEHPALSVWGESSMMPSYARDIAASLDGTFVTAEQIGDGYYLDRDDSN